MPTAQLSIEEQFAFNELVLRSVAARYADGLERHEDPRGKCGPLYTPYDDTTDIRELFIELWGERLLLDEIDLLQDELFKLGLERDAWPLAWCEEELDEEREALAREQIREEAAREEHEARMRAIERIEEGTGDGHEAQKSEDDLPL